MSRTYYWCFTLNNPTDVETANLAEKLGSLQSEPLNPVMGLGFLVYGFERGEEGTPHLQGYCEFNSRVRLPAVKAAIGNRSHVEPRKGTFWEAYEYCCKDGDFRQGGKPRIDDMERGQSGKRTDLERIRLGIIAGQEEKTIADTYFSQWVRYNQSFRQYADMCRDRVDRPGLRVILLHGPPGTGKTRLVWEFARSKELQLFSVPDPGLRWFDGYNGHDIALFDDFAGNSDYRFLLRLLDRYPLDVPVKGRFVYWEPTYIFITTNVQPEDWFPNEDVTALRRRIHAVINVDGSRTPEELLDAVISDPRICV